MQIIGTGVDITEVKRLRDAVQKWGDEFLRKVFTPLELKNARTRISTYQHLAGRFAAKEAVFKALGDKNLKWHDLEIINDSDGKPHCKILNHKGNNIEVAVSISHVKSYAVAHAIVTQKTK